MSKQQKIVIWDAEVRDAVHRILDALKFDGKPWQITLKRFYESPSDRQRGYYRTVVLPHYCRHVEYSTGKHFTPDQMHECLKKKFGPTVHMELWGEAYEVVDFTTGDSGEIAAMTLYLDRLLNYAAGNLGLYIPPPTEKWERKKCLTAER